MEEYIVLANPAKTLTSQELQIIAVNRYGSLKFENGQWNKESMEGICQRIKVWAIKAGLFISTYVYSKETQMLDHIYFPNLQKICLFNTQLYSLQRIVRLRTPQLSSVIIENNNISELKSLRKLFSQNLSYLCIRKNPITEYQVQLSEMNMRKLQWVQFQWRSADRVVCEDIKWLVRSSSKKLGHLFIMGEHRIINKKMESCLKRKWEGSEIKHFEE